MWKGRKCENVEVEFGNDSLGMWVIITIYWNITTIFYGYNNHFLQ